ncbi:hypothetical protein N9L68_07085 [bacterium]|nr:hypothetical protein [bacterium]
MPSPPAAIVMMGKGKGGKGNKWTSWAREVGTYAYLKNFRKGLRYQRERCERELEAAAAAIDAAIARAATERWLWILEKQDILDKNHEMVWGMPVTHHGMQMKEYGSLERAARRRLTNAEIRWNAELIEAERLQQRHGSASGVCL